MGPIENIIEQYQLWVLACFLRVRCMLHYPSLPVPSTSKAASHSFPTPQSGRTSSGEMRHNPAVLCQWSHLMTGIKNWFSLPSPQGTHPQAVLPTFILSPFSSSITSINHYFHMKPLAFLSLLLLRNFRKLPFTCPQPSPPVLHLGAKTKLNWGWWTDGQL